MPLLWSLRKLLIVTIILWEFSMAPFWRWAKECMTSRHDMPKATDNNDWYLSKRNLHTHDCPSEWAVTHRPPDSIILAPRFIVKQPYSLSIPPQEYLGYYPPVTPPFSFSFILDAEDGTGPLAAKSVVYSRATPKVSSASSLGHPITSQRAFVQRLT